MGLGVGLLAGTFGVGGGVLAVPALVLLAHLDQHAAEGTSLAAIVPTAAWALWRYRRRGLVRGQATLRVGLAATAAAFAGAHLALALSSEVLRLTFAAFVAFLAARSALHDRRAPRPRPEGGAAAPSASPAAAGGTGPRAAGGRTADAGPRPGPSTAAGTPAAARPESGTAFPPDPAGGDPADRPAVEVAVGAGLGLLSGLLGIGGGSLGTPALVLLARYPQQVAQGTVLGVVVLSSLAGAVRYALGGRVDWPAAAALVAGALVTVPLGAAIAHRLPERSLRRVFAVFLTAVAVLEAVQAR